MIHAQQNVSSAPPSQLSGVAGTEQSGYDVANIEPRVVFDENAHITLPQSAACEPGAKVTTASGQKFACNAQDAPVQASMIKPVIMPPEQ